MFDVCIFSSSFVIMRKSRYLGEFRIITFLTSKYCIFEVDFNILNELCTTIFLVF